jgi:hypothetical protein
MLGVVPSAIVVREIQPFSEKTSVPITIDAFYSIRKACIGSTRIARRAGM